MENGNCFIAWSLWWFFVWVVHGIKRETSGLLLLTLENISINHKILLFFRYWHSWHSLWRFLSHMQFKEVFVQSVISLEFLFLFLHIHHSAWLEWNIFQKPFKIHYQSFSKIFFMLHDLLTCVSESLDSGLSLDFRFLFGGPRNQLRWFNYSLIAFFYFCLRFIF